MGGGWGAASSSMEAAYIYIYIYMYIYIYIYIYIYKYDICNVRGSFEACSLFTLPPFALPPYIEIYQNCNLLESWHLEVRARSQNSHRLYCTILYYYYTITVLLLYYTILDISPRRGMSGLCAKS